MMALLNVEEAMGSLSLDKYQQKDRSLTGKCVIFINATLQNNLVKAFYVLMQ